MGALPIADAHAALRREIEGLPALDLAALRAHWRQRLRTTPPAALTRPLLMRLLAYKLQARAFGDLDPGTARLLDRLAREHARRRDAGERLPRKTPPPVPPVSRERSLMPGTLLVRQHGGVQHRVVVLAEGYLWQGCQYPSLSEIARAITGTRWNGPRFFGLRASATAQGDSATAGAAP